MVTFPRELLRRCWFLAGPTASGKTLLSVMIADRIGAEIIGLDSMTIYRGLDIGTAKPAANERGGIPHHLFDVRDPIEEYSVADFVNDAAKAAEDVVGRGKTPLFVGGSGLYLRTLLRGLFEGPAANGELRSRLEEELSRTSPQALHTRLAQVDPALAARLPPADTRRVLRGLEVFELTGKRLSEQQTQEVLPPECQPERVVWLDSDRSWLHQRIEIRARQMFEEGLVSETQSAIARGGFGRTAAQAIGYADVLRHLRGECSAAVALQQTVIHTRQFAKRQCTWFRNLEECRAIPVNAETHIETLVKQINDDRPLPA